MLNEDGPIYIKLYEIDIIKKIYEIRRNEANG